MTLRMAVSSESGAAPVGGSRGYVGAANRSSTAIAAARHVLHRGAAVHLGAAAKVNRVIRRLSATSYLLTEVASTPPMVAAVRRAQVAAPVSVEPENRVAGAATQGA
jgi:hypothetical protein